MQHLLCVLYSQSGWMDCRLWKLVPLSEGTPPLLEARVGQPCCGGQSVSGWLLHWVTPRSGGKGLEVSCVSQKLCGCPQAPSNGDLSEEKASAGAGCAIFGLSHQEKPHSRGWFGSDVMHQAPRESQHQLSGNLSLYLSPKCAGYLAKQKCFECSPSKHRIVFQGAKFLAAGRTFPP